MHWLHLPDKGPVVGLWLSTMPERGVLPSDPFGSCCRHMLRFLIGQQAQEAHVRPLKPMCLCSLPLITSLMRNSTSNAFFIYQGKAILLAEKFELRLRSTNGTLMEHDHSLQAEKWTAVLLACWSKPTLNLQCSTVSVTEREQERFNGSATVSWGRLTALPTLPFRFVLTLNELINARHINKNPCVSITHRHGSNITSLSYEWDFLHSPTVSARRLKKNHLKKSIVYII